MPQPLVQHVSGANTPKKTAGLVASAQRIRVTSRSQDVRKYISRTRNHMTHLTWSIPWGSYSKDEFHRELDMIIQQS